MKTMTNKYVRLLFLLLLFGGNCPEVPASTEFLYERKDEADEKKRYLIKLEQDKTKCEKAIINTKTLISRSKNKPYLTELYLRLAELYIEKSRIVYFIRRAVQEQKNEGALEQYEANMLKRQALEIYQRILTHYPDFEDSDKVHFFMAHEYRELGQMDKLVKEYKTIISDYPDSQYAPEAHLLLGDYYFSQKQDVDNSKAHYEAVLRYPKSPAIAAARYKLAWCRINLADHEGALKLFEESVNSIHTQKELDIDTYQRVDVRMESLIDMAFCYPEVHKKATPSEAIEYFRRNSWSRPVFTTVLEKLAYRYYVKKKWAVAAAIYRELADLRQDPEKLVEYAKHIFESVQAMGSYENAEKDVGLIIQALNKQKYSVHLPESEKMDMIKNFEIYARDLITHLHEKARKSNSVQDFRIAADAYKQYLDFFVESPACAEMASNYAEALFSSEQFLEAGKQYEKITPLATINNKQRKEKLNSAVISYYQSLKNKDNLNYYQAAYAREGLRNSGKTYAAEFPDSEKTPDVLFNVAWVAYDAGDYETAIHDFTEFVNTFPRHKGAEAGAHLVIDAFHLMEDYEGMIKYGKSILSAPEIGNRKFKHEIAQIVQDAESKKVSSITMSAVNDWESAREDLLQVAKESKSSAMGEQALNALIISSRDKKDLQTLFSSANQLIRNYPHSHHVQETMGILIDTAIKIGQFRLLADYQEKFVHRFPKNENYQDFLMQAAQIREGLGEYPEANKNYLKLISTCRLTREQLENAAFSFVKNAEKTKDYAGAIDILETCVSKFSGISQVRAYAHLSSLNYLDDRRTRAKTYSQKARKGYQPEMGTQDPVLCSLMAELAYRNIFHSSGQYYDLKLRNKIDNGVVKQKTKMLKTLEDGYQEVMSYKSPPWLLRACFRANEINTEFAEFLVNAPLPKDLTVEQRRQYRDLIQQKARGYLDKAEQYRQTCVQMAIKMEICEPGLADYFIPAGRPQGREGSFQATAEDRGNARIGSQGLADREICEIYLKLLNHPEDPGQNFSLAVNYLKKKDYNQAALIAKNTLSKIKNSDRKLKAELLNLLGISHLKCGRDALAKNAFTQALEADEHLVEARMNLADIYRHYEHRDKAEELMKDAQIQPLTQQDIHPQTGGDDNAFFKPNI